ncbi:DUF2510 domain-containing protein [Marmoricola sp. Leaf446]|nr:DUF2510 domain-containing protein [Marmoricola sp. Leaf446]
MPATSTRPGADWPVGWYRDPVDARLHRYWTGSAWLDADAYVWQRDR